MLPRCVSLVSWRLNTMYYAYIYHDNKFYLMRNDSNWLKGWMLEVESIARQDPWIMVVLLIIQCLLYFGILILFLSSSRQWSFFFRVAEWHGGHPCSIYSSKHSWIQRVRWFIVALLCSACTIMNTFMIRSLVPLPFYLLLLYPLMNQSKALTPDGMAIYCFS